MTNALDHAFRRFFRLTRGTTFIATLAAATATGASLAQNAAAGAAQADAKQAEVKPTEGKAAAETFTVDSVWNGKLVPRDDGLIRIVNETWNGDVCQGQSFTIGMQCSGSPSPPADLMLNGSPVEPAP